LIFTAGYKPLAGYTAPEEEALQAVADAREGLGVAVCPPPWRAWPPTLCSFAGISNSSWQPRGQ